MRETAEKRHNDWVKAIHKYKLYPNYYDNLHQYSKNKIPCPLHKRYKAKNRIMVADERKNEAMDDQLEDLTFNEIDV